MAGCDATRNQPRLGRRARVACYRRPRGASRKQHMLLFRPRQGRRARPGGRSGCSAGRFSSSDLCGDLPLWADGGREKTRSGKRGEGSLFFAALRPPIVADPAPRQRAPAPLAGLGTGVVRRYRLATPPNPIPETERSLADRHRAPAVARAAPLPSVGGGQPDWRKTDKHQCYHGLLGSLHEWLAKRTDDNDGRRRNACSEEPVAMARTSLFPGRIETCTIHREPINDARPPASRARRLGHPSRRWPLSGGRRASRHSTSWL